MEADLLELARRALWLSIALSAPLVGLALAVGLLVGLLQAATQIQEFTLSFAPKVIGVLLLLSLLAPWIGEQLVQFFRLGLGG